MLINLGSVYTVSGELVGRAIAIVAKAATPHACKLQSRGGLIRKGYEHCRAPCAHQLVIMFLKKGGAAKHERPRSLPRRAEQPRTAEYGHSSAE